MKKSLLRIFLLFVIGMMGSCSNDSLYSGFTKMESGAYMKFYSRSDATVSPRLRDGVTFEMAQYFNDSLLFTTVGDEPIDIVLEPGAFVGDVTDALLMMHIGDSARIAVPADSVFTVVMQMDVPEEYGGKVIYYDVKLLSITPFEEIEVSYSQYLDSLRMEEQVVLNAYKNDLNNTVTESGLIIISNIGKGRVAKLGDFVNFDFIMCSLDDDTIMNSYPIESVDIQYGGEDFIAKGFTEAIGLVPEGGRVRFLVPSSLAFDSAGYAGIISPYMPLVVEMRMNRVMNKSEHDKYLQEKESKELAQYNKMLENQRRLIIKYVKDNAITEEPSETGLYLIRKEEGEGRVAQFGDHVAVHYVLFNLNGEEVESSYKFGQTLDFTIGSNEMIPAIEEAVSQMNSGAKVRLIVPSELGFGSVAVDEELLPADSPLVIDLELVSIK